MSRAIYGKHRGIECVADGLNDRLDLSHDVQKFHRFSLEIICYDLYYLYY